VIGDGARERKWADSVQAQAYVIDGYRFVVDIDLAKFFDRVNHDAQRKVLASPVVPITASNANTTHRHSHPDSLVIGRLPTHVLRRSTTEMDARSSSFCTNNWIPPTPSHRVMDAPVFFSTLSREQLAPFRRE
jgi:hypothetical protein